MAHPVHMVFSIDLLPSEFHAFLGRIDMDQVPQSYDEAKQIQHWLDAVKAGIEAMEKNQT